MDHCQDPNAIPLTQEEISNLVFKKKSSIVKGLRMRPSSSLVTTASSNSSVECIQRLENEIIELKEARARDQDELAKDKRHELSKMRSKRIFLTFLGARVMVMLLLMGVVQLQVKTLFRYNIYWCGYS